MPFVVWTYDRFEKVRVAPGSANVFWRASTGAFYEAGIDDSWERRLPRFDDEREAPVVAIVVDIFEKAIAFLRDFFPDTQKI